MRKTRHLMSYLAGIFDGEGSVMISKQTSPRPRRINPTYRVRLQVNMTDSLIPQLFQNTFGGHINKFKPKKPNSRLAIAWTLAGHNCLDVLRELMPYVILKRPQMEVAKHFLLNTPKQWSWGLTEEELALREVDYILCHQLKKGG